MPFGLKNAGLTYQRAMTILFHDVMHREIEVYVDYMIAKSLDAEDHLNKMRIKTKDSGSKSSVSIQPNVCSVLPPGTC